MSFGNYDPYRSPGYGEQEYEYQDYAEASEQMADEQYIEAAEQYIVNELATGSQDSFFASLRKLGADQRKQIDTTLRKIERNEALTNEEKDTILNFLKPLAPYFRMFIASSSFDPSRSLMEDRIKKLQQRLNSLQENYQKTYGSNISSK